MIDADGDTVTANGDSGGRFPHPVRGTLMVVLLGPVFIVGIIVAIFGLASAFFAGWIPTRWFSSNAADWLIGTGVAGDASNYLLLMGGGLLAGLSGIAIRWGFYGDVTW